MITLDSNDSRQGHIGDELSRLLLGPIRSTDIEVEPLPWGDLAMTGLNQEGKPNLLIGFEFKHYPTDALASIRDKRLEVQPIKMLVYYDVSYVVFIGTPASIDFDDGTMKEHIPNHRKSRPQPIRWHRFNSPLLKFEAGGGHIRHVPDLEHLASLIASSYRFWNNPDRKTEIFIKNKSGVLDFSIFDNPLVETYERMGIGIKAAKALALVAPDMQILVQMTNKDLMNVPSLGRQSAKKIRDLVGCRLEGQEFLK